VIVGVPTERKPGENRVALTPDGTRELVTHGHRVLVEMGAGAGSSIHDDDFARAGAELVSCDEVWNAGLVLKVKEPQAEEFGYLRPGLVLFTFLHLAAYSDLADALLASGAIALGYETVRLPSGALPLLAPMSEVAGRLAPQVGAHFLERGNGGRGVLLGGAPGVRPARVVVIGAGTVGTNAAWIAQGMEAEVFLIDRDLDRLRVVDQIHRGRIMTLASNRAVIERSLGDADLVIGAVLVPGGRAPVVVTEDMVRAMKPGSVIMDVAVDQGGSVGTPVWPRVSRPCPDTSPTPPWRAHWDGRSWSRSRRSRWRDAPGRLSPCSGTLEVAPKSPGTLDRGAGAPNVRGELPVGGDHGDVGRIPDRLQEPHDGVIGRVGPTRREQRGDSRRGRCVRLVWFWASVEHHRDVVGRRPVARGELGDQASARSGSVAPPVVGPGPDDVHPVDDQTHLSSLACEAPSSTAPPTKLFGTTSVGNRPAPTTIRA
jgi:alanine dehydrogenase